MQCTANTCQGNRCKKNSKTKLVCSQHSNQVFPVSQFHLLHSIELKYLEKILQSKAILPLSETNVEPNYKNVYQNNRYYGDFVFTSLIFPLNDTETTFYPTKYVDEKSIYFLFSPKLMTKSKNSYWCKTWDFGSITKQCRQYNAEKSLKWNLNTLRNNYDVIQEDDLTDIFINNYYLYPNTRNEVIFSESIPLDTPELEYIYVSRKHKEFEKIMDIASQYPDYPWIFENPLIGFHLNLDKVKKYVEEILEDEKNHHKNAIKNVTDYAENVIETQEKYFPKKNTE